MEYKVLLVLIFSIGGFLYFQSAHAQFLKTAACANPDFDKKVDSYLSYSVPVISVKEVFANQGLYTFLDAREKEEFQISHIKGAKNIGYDYMDMNVVKSLPKNQPIVVYCSIGYRSEKIAARLRKEGFINVFNLYGSIFEWVNAGYPIYKGDIPVKKLHTFNKKWSQWMLNQQIEKIY
ncbi:MAG: rhodanese-like domain-containing protein [Saprospiraceae bacterium]